MIKKVQNWLVDFKSTFNFIDVDKIRRQWDCSEFSFYTCYEYQFFNGQQYSYDIYMAYEDRIHVGINIYNEAGSFIRFMKIEINTLQKPETLY